MKDYCWTRDDIESTLDSLCHLFSEIRGIEVVLLSVQYLKYIDTWWLAWFVFGVYSILFHCSGYYSYCFSGELTILGKFYVSYYIPYYMIGSVLELALNQCKYCWAWETLVLGISIPKSLGCWPLIILIKTALIGLKIAWIWYHTTQTLVTRMDSPPPGLCSLVGKSGDPDSRAKLPSSSLKGVPNKGTLKRCFKFL